MATDQQGISYTVQPTHTPKQEVWVSATIQIRERFMRPCKFEMVTAQEGEHVRCTTYSPLPHFTMGITLEADIEFRH